MKKKFKNDREKNEELLKEIIIFNGFVVKYRYACNYRELQIEKEFEVPEEKIEDFNKKISELNDCIILQKSNIEMKFDLKLSDECLHNGLLPELYLDYELKYFLDKKESKFKKINKVIQENLVI